MATRDAQRARCYKAEREVFTYYPGRVLASTPNATMGDYKFGKAMGASQMADLQLLIGNSKRLTTKYRGGQAKNVRLKIDSRRTRGGAASYNGIIKYSPRAMLDWIVCHEMAHELNDRTFGVPGDLEHLHASHGWRFCAIYLDVVRRVLGVEAHDALKASFKRNKVRFTPPTKKRAKKDPTPAQLAARAKFAEQAKQRAADRRAQKGATQ
jgi:hypothetical protein